MKKAYKFKMEGRQTIKEELVKQKTAWLGQPDLRRPFTNLRRPFTKILCWNKERPQYEVWYSYFFVSSNKIGGFCFSHCSDNIIAIRKEYNEFEDRWAELLYDTRVIWEGRNNGNECRVVLAKHDNNGMFYQYYLLQRCQASEWYIQEYWKEDLIKVREQMKSRGMI
jgi:hypothetical protein